MPLSCEINERTAHKLCCHGEEVCPVLPTHILPIDQPYVCLINKCGSLQSVTGTLAAHVMMGQPAQFRVHQRSQLIQRCLITFTPGDQELRDFFRGVRLHSNLLRRKAGGKEITTTPRCV